MERKFELVFLPLKRTKSGATGYQTRWFTGTDEDLDREVDYICAETGASRVQVTP